MRNHLPRVACWKRMTDLVISSIVIVLLAPVMLLVAVLVKLSSAGPVFYVAKRAGYRGRTFGQLKFRTMHVGADRHGAFTCKNDARIFPVGKFLRLFRLDELPQFFNILRGEMSIVGPRPEDAAIVEQCYTPEQRQVLNVAPGITCLRQVKFFPDCAELDAGNDSQQHYREVILPMLLEMDLQYVRQQSFWLDLRLIVLTAYLVLFKSWYVLLRRHKRKALPLRSSTV